MSPIRQYALPVHVALVLFVLANAAATAQPAGLEPGTRIRLHLAGQTTHVGMLDGMARDTLVLMPADPGGPVRVALADIRRIDRSAGFRSHTLVGAGLGLLGGAALGGAVANATYREPARRAPRRCPPDDWACALAGGFQPIAEMVNAAHRRNVGIVLGAAAGAVIGAAIGNRHVTEQWRSATLSASVGAAPSPGGGLAVSAALRPKAP